MTRQGYRSHVVIRPKQGTLGCLLRGGWAGPVGTLQPPRSQPQPQPRWPEKVLCSHFFPGTTSGTPAKLLTFLLPLSLYKVNLLLLACRAYTHLVPPPLQSWAPHLGELMGPYVLLTPLA